MARTPIPTWFFVLVVVRHGDGERFLLVQERKYGQQWYFPAGRVEPGESLAAAACRETWEEAGMRVRLDGVLRIEHSLIPGGARVRVLYTAQPVDDAPPKQQPDDESLRAAWVRLEDLAHLPLRSSEVLRVLTEVSQGAPVHPLSVIAPEGASLLEP
jgi:8-oxo-dGTP pyrophosphatase MutT (NUDIX family)